ncbi:carbohydrate porin [Aliidiomarina maris]|uniref:Phosphate-selective porin O/P n=1 Tax=Aliidiomarina maris TaxID=531312 RepID=A0A327WSA0_9GAMM|nr:carbohydrate porin [Aliidiomarina maris]RAJ95303.1 hypothetical protein B0I24_11189 [Aliidiomarina maris]RUO21005.1 hypothetical protein CWE07_11565 [Aliidiomarina maris]
MTLNRLSIAILSATTLSVAGLTPVSAQQNDESRLQALEQRMAELEAELAIAQRNLRAAEEEAEQASGEQSSEQSEDGIEFGGAVRFQYVLADYDEGQKNRGGDLQFDIFRLNFDGQMNNAILSAEYRWYEYMDALRHAYFGYNFTEKWQGQVGVVIQPWGVMPYNSHSYFFSSNFYVGFEDNPGSGVRFQRRGDEWDLDFAFILNDDLGGTSGDVRSRADSYNYNVTGIRLPGEDPFADPEFTASENNTLITRIARKWDLDGDLFELGVSAQYGDVDDGLGSVGSKTALGLHSVYHTGRWEFHAQWTHYDYDLDIENEGIIVGAYAYFDTIPTRSDIFTGNVAYNYPFEWGPIQSLQFYNNTSLITNKRGYDEDTVMNVIGMAVAAGGIYTYIDLVSAKNQPFANGSVVGESDRWNTRFNINFGYYF